MVLILYNKKPYYFSDWFNAGEQSGLLSEKTVGALSDHSTVFKKTYLNIMEWSLFEKRVESDWRYTAYDSFRKTAKWWHLFGFPDLINP